LLFIPKSRGKKKKEERNIKKNKKPNLFFLSFLLFMAKEKKNSDSGLGDEVFFLLLFLVLQLQSSSIERPAPRYSRAPFSDFYRCRSQIRKREMRHLVRREPRKDFHSIQSIAESK
jgi:hypothetical protein